MSKFRTAVTVKLSKSIVRAVRCSRSTGWLVGMLSVTVVACDSGMNADNQVEQCRDVVAFWSAPHSDLQHGISQVDGLLTVDVSMTIKSALGEQAGSGRCTYSLAENGALATKPTQIVVGKTVLTSDKDIADALAMSKDFDLPAHKH